MTSRLASLLVQDGHVTAPRMAEAFQRQVIYGGTLDTILLEMGLVDEEVVLEYLARAAELPLVEAEAEGAPAGDDPAARWFAASLAERYHVAPIALSGRTACLMVTDPPD